MQNIVNIEENKNNVVVKHQELVHNARYRLSELSLKVLSVLISMIKISDTEFTQYTLKITDFRELINSNSNNTYGHAHKLIEELLSNPIKIADEQFNWISYGKYLKGEGVMVFEVHRLLKPYLLDMQKNFLQYNIKNILVLKSGYVIRLYELCKDAFVEETRYKTRKQAVLFELKIERIRELFQVPKSYQYKDIRVHILDKAVKQFKEKTDIQISYEEQKIGRKVDRVIISIKENNKGSADYLSTLQSFIKHCREQYVNADLIEAKNKHTQKIMIISVATNGTLYDKRSTEAITADRAEEMWKTLYELAKNDELKVKFISPSLFKEDAPVVEKVKTVEETDATKKLHDIRDINELFSSSGFLISVQENLDYKATHEDFISFVTYHKQKQTKPKNLSKWIAYFEGWILQKLKNKRK